MKCLCGSIVVAFQAALRQTEIEELGAVPRDHDVAWLQITMNDTCFVRPAQRIGDVGAVPQHLISRQWSFRQNVRKRLTLDELHHEVVNSVLVTDIVNRADVRMIETRDRSGLALETSSHLRARSEIARQDLDCDAAVEARIACAEYFAHAAGADARDDLVRT